MRRLLMNMALLTFVTGCLAICNSYAWPEATANSVGGAKVIPAGSEVVVRTNQTIDSQKASEGQQSPALVDKDVVDSNGTVTIPKGAEPELVIRKVSAGGTFGTPELSLDIDAFTVGGERYAVSPANLEEKGRQGIGNNKRTAEMTGGGAVLGGLLGAIAGKGKGAAIGAIVSATAGERHRS